jgi:hypothetical protein
VKDNVLYELRGGELRAYALQHVVLQGEQRTALPEARVQTHAQSEEECAELPVRESGEVAVCVFIAAGPMIKLCAGSA